MKSKFIAIIILVFLISCSDQSSESQKTIDKAIILSATEKSLQAYEKNGITGIQLLVDECYEELVSSEYKFKNRNISYEYCIAVDLTGYQIDSNFQKIYKSPPHPFFERDIVFKRVKSKSSSTLNELKIKEILVIVNEGLSNRL